MRGSGQATTQTHSIHWFQFTSNKAGICTQYPQVSHPTCKGLITYVTVRKVRWGYLGVLIFHGRLRHNQVQQRKSPSWQSVMWPCFPSSIPVPICLHDIPRTSCPHLIFLPLAPTISPPPNSAQAASTSSPALAKLATLPLAPLPMPTTLLP
jgi:hypothetical protein